nr:tetratricopeptide repeat protein [Kibdelosporangium sp. MJ126-NF4]
MSPELPPQLLPRQTSHFTSRDANLALLDKLARRHPESPTVLVIVGPPGVGKSALVVHWAHRAKADFPDGILYADLRGVDPVNPAAEPQDILDGFLAALHFPEARIAGTLDSKAGLFRSAVSGRRMIVVLDNARSAEQVRPLLPGASTVAVVVTSRNALSGLVVREGAVSVHLAPLEIRESVDLLREIVGIERLAGHDAGAQRLAEICGNLPLALRIAADRIVTDPYTTIDGLAAELADERERLDLLETDDPATTVRTVFAVSYRTLAETPAAVFRLLSLHPGPYIGRAAASALTGLGPAKLRRSLEILVAACLLQPHQPDQFRFHDLLRIYAAECAEIDEHPDTRFQAVHAALKYYSQTAQRAALLLDPYRRPVQEPPPAGEGGDFADADAAMTWFVQEQANLVAATREAARIGVDVAWQLPLAMQPFLYRRKLWADWISTHQIGLRAAEGVDVKAAVAAVAGGLAIAYREQRAYPEAEAYFERALNLWIELRDPYNTAWACNAYGQARRERHDLVGALELASRAYTLFSEVGDQHGKGVSGNSLSGIHRELGNFDAALDHSNEAVGSFRSINDRYGEVWALNNLAAVHADLGNLEEAAQLYEDVAERRERIGDTYGLTFTLLSLAAVLRRLDRRKESERLLRQVLTTCVELDDPRVEEIRRQLDR